MSPDEVFSFYILLNSLEGRFKIEFDTVFLLKGYKAHAIFPTKKTLPPFTRAHFTPMKTNPINFINSTLLLCTWKFSPGI